MLVEKGRGSRKGKEKGRKGENKERKEKEKEKKERKRKKANGFFLGSLAFRRLELVGLRSKVQRFDVGLRFKR